MKYISKATNWIVGVLMLVSLTSIDSQSWWPMNIFVGCWVYFMVVAYRNGWLYEPETEDEA